MLNMNLQLAVLIFAAAAGALSLAFSIISFFNNRKNREVIEALIDELETFENELAEQKNLHEDVKGRAADQARRIAWLEARTRKPAKIEKDVLSREVLTSEPEKPMNMTERRHRVLSLASRGQDAETIASTLGMIKGEVELIINLGRGAAAKHA